jgi:SAM-dependent methyltransferase
MPSNSIAGEIHARLLLTRRASILAKSFAALLPPHARVLDVGCGDGIIDHLIQQIRPDVNIDGIDVLVRPNPKIQVKSFNGSVIPYPDASFDAAMFIDVLHHTGDPFVLLKEGARVARTILIKDHLREGFLSETTLRFMDWFGNAHHGVALPYNYWSRTQWEAAFSALDVAPSWVNTSLGLYPSPASWLFERKFHFIAKIDHIERANQTSPSSQQ